MPVIHYRKTRRIVLGKYTNVPWITGERNPKSHTLNSYSSDTHKKLQTLAALPDKTIASFFNLSRSQTQSFYNRAMKRKKKQPAPWAVSGCKSQPEKCSPYPPPYSLSLKLTSSVCKEVTSCWECPQRLLEPWFICRGNHWQHQCLPAQLGLIPFHNDRSGGEGASYTDSYHVQTILQSHVKLGLQEA